MNPAWFASQAERTPPGAWLRESSVATAKAIYGLISMTRPGHVVEVGTFHGDTTVWIARALVENKIGTCTSYEVDAEIQEIARQNLVDALGEEHGVNLVLEDITQRSVPVECDFVFIDPDPKELYLPVFEKLSLPVNGTLCAHDLYYQRGLASPVVALEKRLIESKQWEVIGFPQERGLIVARKVA